MTQLLEKVFAKVGKLPTIEQNAVAKWILEELDTLQKVKRGEKEFKNGKTRTVNSLADIK